MRRPKTGQQSKDSSSSEGQVVDLKHSSSLEMQHKAFSFW